MNNEITDPSDWKPTPAAFMGPIESTLSCHICKEMFTAPVLTGCCHTFCSLCIRSALNTENKCPVCRSEVQASGLRKNIVMEELIELYRPSRATLFNLITNYDENPRNRKRAKINTDSNDDDEIEITKVQLRTPEKSKDMGQCPICQKTMKISEIESTHIASCLSGSSDTNTTPPKFFRKRESKIDMTKKLPFVAYNMIKEADLRNLLKQQGISTLGLRQQLQDRYTEFITLWNSNADAKTPVSKQTLMERLRDWERTMDTNKRRKRPELDAQEWANAHKSSFEELILRAKKI